jgi:hypothetical protein
MKTMKKQIIILALLVILAMIPGVLAIDITTLDPGTSTDWTLWVLSGLLGLILFLFSLNAATSSVEVEIDAIVSVMAWIPIAFCAYASFNVSRVIGVGEVTLYSMGSVGMLMTVFLIIAISNTVRLILLHKVFTGEPKQQESSNND